MHQQSRVGEDAGKGTVGARVYARQLGPVLQRLGRRDEVVRCLITAMREQSVESGTTVLKVLVANDTSSIHPSQEYASFCGGGVWC